jgi:hypothetical protein
VEKMKYNRNWWRPAEKHRKKRLLRGGLERRWYQRDELIMWQNHERNISRRITTNADNTGALVSMAKVRLKPRYVRRWLDNLGIGETVVLQIGGLR